MRALLRLADHRARARAAHRDANAPAVPKLKAFRYNFPWEKLTGVQTLVDVQLVAGDYLAHRLVDLVNELYPAVAEETTDVWENRKALENAIVANWLLLSKAQIEENDEGTPQWQSRDIGPQKAVYAATNFSPFEKEGDPLVFSNSMTVNELKLAA